MDIKSLEKQVESLDKILKDCTFEPWVAGILPRDEDVSLKELRQNTDMSRQIEDSPAGEGLYFLKKRSKRSDQAYIKNGAVVIVVDHDLYQIPLDDIQRVERWKKGRYEKMVAFLLPEGYIFIYWTPKSKVREVEAGYRKILKGMKRKGNWYTL